MIEVWERDRVLRIVAGDQSLEINRDDLSALIEELMLFEKQGQWNSAEIKRLCELAADGRKPSEIARLVGRSRLSVNNKLWRLRRDGALEERNK